jgi:predicted enzyme related to lactoylglutathione lyase
MTDHDRYPPGVPCWVDIAQPDPDAAARFYGGLFGWSFDDAAPPGAPAPYLMARLGGTDVAAITAGDATPAWNTYVRVESASDAVARAREAGATVLAEPRAAGDAGVMAVLADPSGAQIRVWEPAAFGGAGLVNAAGSWNWSDLSTDDPDGARAFYGALFGWEADPIDFGDGGGSMMWRRPGYGDVLEQRDPGIRRRHAEHGAPPGFTDAIGWLQPLPGPDVAPHWHVTFAVDDADGAARRAGELGGTVAVPPFEAGPTRVAVLADPAGAAFTVSHYAPG